VFGSTKDGEATTVWAGVNAAASLRQDRRLTWYCAHEGEPNRWRRELDLPNRVSAADVASICPSIHGLTLVTRAGALHVWDAARATWDARGVVDGAA
jgi:hypothetical protein